MPRLVSSRWTVVLSVVGLTPSMRAASRKPLACATARNAWRSVRFAANVQFPVQPVPIMPDYRGNGHRIDCLQQPPRLAMKEISMSKAAANHLANHLANPLTVAVTQGAVVPGKIGDVFDFVAAEDVLPKILTGYGLVPAVAFTSDVSGPWDQPGSHRVVHLADGSTVDEGVTHYDRPSYFAYRVSNPSFALKHLMTGATGQFCFEAAEGGTRVKWPYPFHARNRLTRLPLTLFVKSQWNGYMDVCIKNIIKHFGS